VSCARNNEFFWQISQLYQGSELDQSCLPTPASSILFAHFSESLGFPAWQVKIDQGFEVFAGQVADWSSFSSDTTTDLRVYHKQPE
jgi:hypothetical protein